MKLQKKLFESKYMNFLWKIKILKTKNNYLIGYIFYVKETFKEVLCVCVYMHELTLFISLFWK